MKRPHEVSLPHRKVARESVPCAGICAFLRCSAGKASLHAVPCAGISCCSRCNTYVIMQNTKHWTLSSLATQSDFFSLTNERTFYSSATRSTNADIARQAGWRATETPGSGELLVDLSRQVVTLSVCHMCIPFWLKLIATSLCAT